MAEKTSDLIINLLKISGGASAQFVAKHLDLSVVGARAHLARLMDRGLVTYSELRGPIGRPIRAWTLTEAGQRRFPDRHAELAMEFLRGAQDAFGKFGVEGVLQARSREIAERYQRNMSDCHGTTERLQRLAELRSLDGYMAEIKEEANGATLLVENNCPIQAAARQCPALCSAELDLLSESLGAEASLKRVEHLLSGGRRCAFRIEVRGEPKGN